LDYVKRSDRKSIPTEDEYFVTQQNREPSPEEKALEREVKEQLFKTCNQLKPPYREIALDFFYHEIPPNQISQQTGKNLKTVQTQIYRAKAMLQKKYKKEAG
jgi:RNA polymerase sigma-70 factor (ECF subfamily)